MSFDLSLNRVYWEYPQTKTHLRPFHGYCATSQIPSLGVRVTVPEYRRRSSSFKNDLSKLVKLFAEKYKDYKFVLALSGGIDSEVTAEMFYELGIPFRGVSLSLFEGANNYDIVFAAKFCSDRDIPYTIHHLGLNQMLKNTIPDAVEHGQFTHSYSQIALTHLFKHVKDDEILIYSGHNPDFHRDIGVGWWEDSPNIVKYAISKKKKFFTFTSLEPIFCHYAANFDDKQPGDKDNDFLYAAFPQLKRRVKMTGWENSDKIIPTLEDRIRDCSAYRLQSFITWDRFTLDFVRKLFIKEGLKNE